MNRRHFLTASAVFGASLAMNATPLRAQGRPLIYADMHSHFGTRASADVREAMADNGMLLIPRTVSADRAVIRHQRGKGFTQSREPLPGELAAEFDRTMHRLRDAHKAAGLLELADAATLTRIAGGTQPAVFIAAEGADFLGGDLKRLETARAEGVLHVQLVHYRVSEVGDICTAMPVHGGLTPFGKDVVRECNRLGILVDVAHATHEGMAQALEISTRPIVYSHGHVIPGTPHWTYGANRARAISASMAKAIADKGGAIGIWTPLTQYRSLDAYAGALMDAAATLGASHVGVGTDMAGLPAGSVMPGYEAYPVLHNVLAGRGVNDDDIRAMLGGNYLRVLQQALVV